MTCRIFAAGRCNNLKTVKPPSARGGTARKISKTGDDLRYEYLAHTETPVMAWPTVYDWYKARRENGTEYYNVKGIA